MQFKFPSNSEASTWSSRMGSHLFFKNMSIYLTEIFSKSGTQVTTTSKLAIASSQWRNPAGLPAVWASPAGAQGTSWSGLPRPWGLVDVPGEKHLHRGGIGLLKSKSELNVGPHNLSRCPHCQAMGTGSHSDPFPASCEVCPSRLHFLWHLFVTDVQNGGGEKVQPQNQTRWVD